MIGKKHNFIALNLSLPFILLFSIPLPICFSNFEGQILDPLLIWKSVISGSCMLLKCQQLIMRQCSFTQIICLCWICWKQPFLGELFVYCSICYQLDASPLDCTKKVIILSSVPRDKHSSALYIILHLERHTSTRTTLQNYVGSPWFLSMWTRDFENISLP